MAGGMATVNLGAAATAKGVQMAKPKVSIGGEGVQHSGSAVAADVQPGQIGGSTSAGLANANRVSTSSGQPVVVTGSGKLPFRSSSVGRVYNDSGHFFSSSKAIGKGAVGYGEGYFGKLISPFEVWRVTTKPLIYPASCNDNKTKSMDNGEKRSPKQP